MNIHFIHALADFPFLHTHIGRHLSILHRIDLSTGVMVRKDAVIHENSVYMANPTVRLSGS